MDNNNNKLLKVSPSPMSSYAIELQLLKTTWYRQKTDSSVSRMELINNINIESPTPTLFLTKKPTVYTLEKDNLRFGETGQKNKCWAVCLTNNKTQFQTD